MLFIIIRYLNGYRQEKITNKGNFMKQFQRILFLMIILLFMFSPTLFAKTAKETTQITGSFEFGASNSSRTGTEKFDTSLDVNIRKEKFEATIDQDFSKEQSGDNLVSLAVHTGIQGNYFVQNNQFVFVGFEYSRDTNAGEDDKTKFGAGYGFKSKFFSIQTGVQVSSTYYGSSIDRESLSDTSIKIRIPLDAVFELLENAEVNFVLDNTDDYEIKTESGIVANLEKNIYAKALWRYERKGQPLEGPNDIREWLLKVGMRF